MKQYTVIGLLLVMTILASCSKEDAGEIRNMEMVYKEQGIPVRTRSLEQEDFSTYVSFTSGLKGLMESTGSALVSDTVEEVLVKVGDYVQKDQPIIRFPKNNPAANYYQAKAGYESAREAYKRIENLYANNGVSRQDYDNTKTQYDVQLANWKTVNDMIEVKAPISGYVTRLAVHEADNVNPGKELFTISNYDQLTAVVWVSDHEIGEITTGQRAFAEWEGRIVNGVVTQVDLSKDQEMKAFAVHVRFGNSDHSIPSGITANIDIETSLTNDTLILHRNEILEDGEGNFVYLDQNGTAVRQNIELGVRQGMYYQVKTGVRAGDNLITEGLNLVRNNSLIRVNNELVKK